MALLHPCQHFTLQQFLKVLGSQTQQRPSTIFVDPVTGRTKYWGRPLLPNRRGPLHFPLQAGATDLPGYRGGHHASKRARPALQSYHSATRQYGPTTCPSSISNNIHFPKEPCSSSTSQQKTPIQCPSTWMWSSSVCQGEASAQTKKCTATSTSVCAQTHD